MPSRPFPFPSKLRGLLALLVLGLAGCGGGGGSGTAVSTPPPAITQVQVGNFVDGPVANLQYSATPSGLSGTTDAQGQFSFKAGDTVTFSYAGISFGSTKPASSRTGAIIVTPLALTGETDPSNSPKAATLAALVNTLDQISAAQGNAGAFGTLVLPLASFDSSGAFTTLVADLVALGNPQTINTTQLQAVLDAVYGSGTFMALSEVNGQTFVTPAVVGSAVAGTVWSGTSTTAANVSTPWYVYFSPDQQAYAFTANGQADTGSWSVNASGTISLTLSNPLGSAIIAVGATSFSGVGVDAGNNPTITLAASQVIAATPQADTYAGAWHASLTPSTAGPAATTALILVDPNGQLHGVVSDGSVLSGSVDLATGAATATSSAAAGIALSLNFATLSGTESSNAVVQDTLVLSRGAGF